MSTFKMADIVDKDLALNNAHLRDCSLHAQYKILFLLYTERVASDHNSDIDSSWLQHQRKQTVLAYSGTLEAAWRGRSCKIHCKSMHTQFIKP